MMIPTHEALEIWFPLPCDRPFTRLEALAAGLTDRNLRALVQSGYLRRPVVGVYVDTRLPDDLQLRARILRKVVPYDCFVADRTAGWLHGANMILAPNDHLQVPQISIFHPAGRGRTRRDIADSGERDILPEDLVVIDGLTATTPLRTGLDLGRRLHRAQGLAALDSLLGLGAFEQGQLLAAVERFAKQRGVCQLRVLAALADGRAQSPGESALRLLWLDAGLPRPELQIPYVENGHELYYLDMGLSDLLFAAEYDGEEWHSAAVDVEHDRRRRNHLREAGGWQIEEFWKEHVFGREKNADWALRDAIIVARASFERRTRFL